MQNHNSRRTDKDVNYLKFGRGIDLLRLYSTYMSITILNAHQTHFSLQLLDAAATDLLSRGGLAPPITPLHLAVSWLHLT